MLQLLYPMEKPAVSTVWEAWWASNLWGCDGKVKKPLPLPETES